MASHGPSRKTGLLAAPPRRRGLAMRSAATAPAPAPAPAPKPTPPMALMPSTPVPQPLGTTTSPPPPPTRRKVIVRTLGSIAADPLARRLFDRFWRSQRVVAPRSLSPTPFAKRRALHDHMPEVRSLLCAARRGEQGIDEEWEDADWKEDGNKDGDEDAGDGDEVVLLRAQNSALQQRNAELVLQCSKKDEQLVSLRKRVVDLEKRTRRLAL